MYRYAYPARLACILWSSQAAFVMPMITAHRECTGTREHRETNEMPEFILPHGDAQSERTFHTMPAFTQGYIEAMFFTDTGSGDDEELEHVTTSDLSNEALIKIHDDCELFQLMAQALLTGAYTLDYDEEQAGRDFWFTRNGHGVGFWDRAVLAVDVFGDGIELGDQLSALCGDGTSFPPVDLYLGDDGSLYL